MAVGKKLLMSILGGAFVALFLIVYVIFGLGDGKLHVFYLDIGQGDSILVRTPGSEYILIDGGPDDVVLERMADVMPFYERTIDVLVLTHPHADHVNGLIDVLERYDVRSVLLTGVLYGSSAYDKFLALVEEEGAQVMVVDGGADFRLGTTILDIVYPLRSMMGTTLENVNNSSISFRLLYGERAFYFSGDLEVEGEEELVERGVDLRADVFKAGHHGSRTSSTEDILDVVKPKWAVISCGVDNQFKHPHPETVTHFRERGILLYRTDLDGTVEMVSDGGSGEDGVRFLVGKS